MDKASIARAARVGRYEKLREKRRNNRLKTVFPRNRNSEPQIIATSSSLKSIVGSEVRKRKRVDKAFDPWDFGPPGHICSFCGAIVWYEERTAKTKKLDTPKFALCCQAVRVKLPSLLEPPQVLRDLLKYDGSRRSLSFRENIRAYNSMFAFTSIGANIDRSINNRPGPYVFRINGQNHHKIGSLLPMPGGTPKFAQLYIYDTTNEVSNRISAITGEGSTQRLDAEVISQLMYMLHETNVIAQAFRMARERFDTTDTTFIRLRLISARAKDSTIYNLPTTSEVAGLIVGDLSDTTCSRDIIVEHKSNGLQRIPEIHPSFMAMQYPLIFPRGEDGYHPNIRYSDVEGQQEICRKRVTMREYYAYRIQQREWEGTTIICSGRLSNQFFVDAYTCVEEGRLRWIRDNQAQLRAELYKGIKDVVLSGDTTSSSIGRRIVLPPSFTGGPRYMAQNFQDAMAICKWYGNPDLFLTFTANPKWPEIQAFLDLIPGQKVEDRPDIVTRVFKIKLNQLLKDLMKGQHFGRVEADDKHPNARDIDNIISAEIPDRSNDPVGYAAVAQFMMHGPCGAANPNSPCMANGNCSKHFPKKFNSETIIDEEGFPKYRRRDTDAFVEKNGIRLDNRFVVPYNRDLVVKYQAHINVEWRNKSKSIKYLFKYLNKGSDRSRVVLEESHRGMGSGSSDQEPENDEIKLFLNCRYLSPCEACWRIFEFDIHYRSVGVERLSFHLPDQHIVTFRDADDLDSVLNRFDIEHTMFTQWLKTNATYPEARELTYVEFPTQWVWESKDKIWKKRKQRKWIGRLIYAHPASGERFYLRMLLNIVRGPTTFEDIRTVNGVLHPTYKEACYALGLLDGDKEWHGAINQAAHWASASQLRDLFVMLLLFCEVSDPCSLWETHWETLSEDILFKQRKILQFKELTMNEEQLKAYALLEIEKLLVKNNRSLKDFPTIPIPNKELLHDLENRLLIEELSYNQADLMLQHSEMFADLNAEQVRIYDAVIGAVSNKTGGFFFVYGPGGTGKTYLYQTILAQLRAEGQIVLAVASSGVVSLLLPGGRTAHSRFAIPIDIDENSTCHIHQGTQLAELLERASLIIWDEAPMDHRYAFEAFCRENRTSWWRFQANITRGSTRYSTRRY